MTLKEKCALIRKEIKKIGYSNRQVSVVGKPCGYSDAIHIYWKDFNLDLEAIMNIAKKYDDVGVDARTGEVLEGGNTYVSFSWDYDFISKEEEKLEEIAKQILAISGEKLIAHCNDTGFYLIAVNTADEKKLVLTKYPKSKPYQERELQLVRNKNTIKYYLVDLFTNQLIHKTDLIDLD